jgi:hypothetical protein
VAADKLEIHKNSMILEDGKWSDEPYKSFMGILMRRYFDPLAAVEFPLPVLVN